VAIPSIFKEHDAELKKVYAAESKKKPKVTFAVFTFDFYDAESRLSVIKGGTINETPALKYVFNQSNYWFHDKDEDADKDIIISNDGSALRYYSHIMRLLGSNEALFEEFGDKVRSIQSKTYRDAIEKMTIIDKELSILTAYAAIAYLGKIAPGCVREFHITSHAFYEGPVLINTDHPGVMTSFEKQKLIDKDGRTSDFTHAEFIQGSKEFKAAFSKDAFSMIWGCNVNSTALEIVLAISKDLEYIPGNSDMIKFRGKKMKIDSFRVSADTVNINGFDKTIQELTDLLEKMLDGGYALALAKASGKIAGGALLGTSSLSDAKHQDFKTKLMHLPFGRPPDSKNENFGPVLKFYKYIFNAEFAKDIISKDIAPYIIEGDPEFGRGYAIFRSASSKGMKKGSAFGY